MRRAAEVILLAAIVALVMALASGLVWYDGATETIYIGRPPYR